LNYDLNIFGGGEMLKIENYFLLLVLLLNLVNILNFTISYADTNEAKSRTDLSLGLDVFFVLYYTFLLLFASSLLYCGRIMAGFIIFMLAIAPFAMEKSSPHKIGKEYINLRIKTLLVNLFIICLI
jgi:hypothetical protein